MGLNYRQVKDIYDQLHSAGVVTKSLPDWSTEMNQLSESDLYGAGLHDNLIKRASVGIDRALEATGIPQAGAAVGGDIGATLGDRAAGERVGQGLGRGAVNFLPLLIPGLGEVQAANLARLGATGLLSGAQTYTETGSPAAGVLSGATAVAMPGVAGAAEKAVLNRMGGQVLEGPITGALGKLGYINDVVPKTLGQGIASQVGGQAAAALFGEASGFGQDVLAGQPLHNPFSVETLLNLTLGQAPFAAIYATKGGRRQLGGKTSAEYIDETSQNIAQTKEVLAQKAALEEAKNRDTIPDLGIKFQPNPKDVAETSMLLSKLRKEKQDLAAEATPDSMEEWNRKSEEEAALVAKQNGFTNGGRGTVGGESQELAPRIRIVGDEHFSKPGYRIIKIADDPANIDLGLTPGELISYSTGKFDKGAEADPLNPNGKVFEVPTGFMTRGVVDNKAVERTTAQAEFQQQHPDLPIQQAPLQLADWRADHKDLQTLSDRLAAATSDDQFRSVLVDYNNKRQEMGVPPLDDFAIKSLQESMGLDADAVLKAEITKSARRLEEKQRLFEETQKKADATVVSLLQPRETALALGEVRDEKGVALANELHAIRAVSPFDAGRFNREVAKWDEAGRPGGMEGLVASMKESKRTGRGKRKEMVKAPEDKVIAEVNKVAGDNTPASTPIKDMIGDIVDSITFDVESDLQDDARTWARMTEEGDKMPAKFANLPHVQEWNERYQELMKKAIEHNSLSKSLTDPSVEVLSEFRPFKPTSPKDVQTMKDWGVSEGGTGIANFLARSVDPETSSLWKSLAERFPEALKRVTAEVWQLSGSRAFRTKDGKVGLLFDSSLLRGDPVRTEITLGHELLHGLTKSELANPSKVEFVDQLTKLRERLIEKLPPVDREAYDNAVKSGWLERWNQGIAEPSELHADPRTRRVLYSLLNNDELISQGFTMGAMRRYMQKVPGTGKGSMWTVFSRWVKELLGLGESVKGTAFDDFLTHTSNILQQGEFVASARNYVERYFQNRGLSPEAVTEQSQRALALVLDGGSKESLLERAVANGIPQTPRWAALKDFVGKITDPVFPQTMAELGYGANPKGLDALTQGILTGEHHGEDVLALLPEAASQYVFERAKDAKELLQAVAGAGKNQATVGVKGNSEAEAAVRATNKLTKLEQQHAKAKTSILAMNGIGGDGVVSRSLSEPDEMQKFVDPLAPKPQFSNWIERMLSLPAQMARQYPAFAEFFAKVSQQTGNARKMRDDALEAMATDAIPDTLAQMKELGVDVEPQNIGATLSEASQKRSEEVVRTPKLTKAVDRWHYLNQKKGKGKEVILSPTDPDVQKALGGLSESEKGLVSEFIQKQSVGTQRMQAKQIGIMKEISFVQGVRLLGRELSSFGSPAPWNERMKISKVALDAAMTDFSDPVAAQASQAALSQLAQTLPPPVFNALIQHVTNARDRIQLWQEQYSQRPAWVSGKDYGRYRAVWQDGSGKVHRVSGDDEKYVLGVAKQGKVLEFTDRGDQADQPVDYGRLSPEVFERFAELERNSWDILGLTPEQRAVAEQQASAARQVAREAQQQGVLDIPGQGRRLSRGAEDIPWTSNFFSYMSATSNYWTRKLLREQHEALQSEPEIQQNSQLKQYTKDYFDGYMAQDPQVAQKLKRFMSTWFLGANVASALANPIGNAMRMVSELTATSGKPLESYSRYLDAAKDVLRNFSGKGKWNSPQEAEVMEEAARRGFRDYNLHDDNAIAQDTLATRYKQLIDQQRPQGLGSRLSTVAGNMGNASMWMFRMGDRYSSTLAILAGYRLYREQGLSHSEAMEKAFEFSHSVNDSGGRSNRPVGPFSSVGEVPRSAALLSTTLQNFVLGSTFQLIRYLKKGLFRPSGLAPAEVFAARKAAVQMLSMQFAAAGALGMPFVSGTIALLDKAFPELELNRKLRETIAGFFQSDSEQGNALSDMALTGVPSALGWDLQSRLSMGNTVPGVSEVNGFQPEQLFGPGASLISQFVKGSQKLASGQGKPSDWSPPAIKKLVDLVSSGGAVRDYKGRPVLNDLTSGEKLGIGLGFQPKRLSDFNAAQRVTEQADDVSRGRENQFLSGLAEQASKGDFGTVRQSLLERTQSEPGFDPVSAVRGIAQKVEELTFPRDLRREGSGSPTSPRNQLLAAFRLDPAQPTEVNRLFLRQQVEQRLGLAVSRSSDIIKAKLMDQLRLVHPDATRSELRRAAEAALSRSSRQTQLLPEPSQ